MTTYTHEEILRRLGNHKPIGAEDAKRGIALRWVATGALTGLLPVGLVLLNKKNPLLNEHVWLIALGLGLLGFLGVFIAWQASTRKLAAERQWGLAALTQKECIELSDLSGEVEDIQHIVDHWLDVWISSGKSPRGRDLALVREMVSAWKAAEIEPVRVDQLAT